MNATELKDILNRDQELQKLVAEAFGEPQFYYEYVIEDEEPCRHIALTLDQLLCEVSKIICFGDCSDERVTKIVAAGKELHYCGWQPGMLYEYVNDEGQTVWSARFENWDH